MLEQGEKDSKPDSSGGLRGLPANLPQIEAPQSMRGDK
jgi:hypothetical protein